MKSVYLNKDVSRTNCLSLYCKAPDHPTDCYPIEAGDGTICGKDQV